jgi:hypothetical protein
MYFHRNILVILMVLCNGQQPTDKGNNAKIKSRIDFISGLLKQILSIKDSIFVFIFLIKS